MKENCIAFVSIKGGVGKTTLALETASSLANDFDKKVLLVDANFSAPNLGLYLDLTNKENYDVTLHDALLGVGLHNAIYEAHGIDVVPAALDYKYGVDPYQLRKILWKMKPRYDFVIIDSSPHYSELLPVIAAADKIFVVTTPDKVTLQTSLRAAQLARQRKTPVEGLIVNRIRNPRYEMDLKGIEDEGGVPVVARVKDSKKMLEALFHKKPIGIHLPGNSVSQEIRRFASALVGTPEEPTGFFQKFLPFKNFGVGKEKVNRQFMRERFYQAQL